MRSSAPAGAQNEVGNEGLAVPGLTTGATVLRRLRRLVVKRGGYGSPPRFFPGPVAEPNLTYSPAHAGGV